MSKIMQGREITWKEEIKNNHWSKKDNSDEIAEKISKTWKNKSDKELKRISDKISKSNIEYIENNGHKFTWSDCESGYYDSNKSENDEYYHSSYEKVRMKELDKNRSVLYWTKQHNISIKYENDFSVRRYIPDFYIEYEDDNVVIEEVKGWIRNETIFEKKKEVAKDYCSKRGYEYVVNFMEHL